MTEEPEENALEEFRELVEEVLDDVLRRINLEVAGVYEVASAIEAEDDRDAMVALVEQMDDLIASTFERAAERLDL